jgi:L-serine/L-threonine ammonia-lyase
MELAADGNAVLLHPFDGEELWQGHSTMMDEIIEDFEGPVPGAIICTVGGGGLLAGILTGLARKGGDWAKVPVVAVETLGADSFHYAAAAGGTKPLGLPGGITSLAKTLGAISVCSGVLDLARSHLGGVISTVVSDRATVEALEKFALGERLLVEPSCSAGLSVLYDDPSALDRLVPGSAGKSVIVIVCGGSGVDMESIARWKAQVSTSVASAELPSPAHLGGEQSVPAPSRRIVRKLTSAEDA